MKLLLTQVILNQLKKKHLYIKKEFGIETKVYSKEEFNAIGHTGEEQFGALSYKPGFAINPLKLLLGLAEEAKKSGVQIYQKSKVTKIEKKLEKFNVITNDHIITSNKIVMATNAFYKDDFITRSE